MLYSPMLVPRPRGRTDCVSAQVKEDVQTETKLIKELMRELAAFRHPPGTGSGSSERAGGHDAAGDASYGGEDGEHATAARAAHAGVAAARPHGGVSTGGEDGEDPDKWPAPTPLPPSNWGKKPSSAAAGADGRSRRSVGGAVAAGSAPPPWAGKPGAAAAAGGGGSKSAAVAASGAAGQAKPAAPRIVSGAASSNAAAGAAAAGKQKVSRHPPLPKEALAKRPGGGASAGGAGQGASHGPPGAGGGAGAGGRAAKPKYSEVHNNAVDAELIQMVENDILDANPNVTFDSIIGLEEAKGLILEAVVLPMLIPGYFQGIRKPWKGVLLFGPPGTGACAPQARI